MCLCRQPHCVVYLFWHVSDTFWSVRLLCGVLRDLLSGQEGRSGAWSKFTHCVVAGKLSQHCSPVETALFFTRVKLVTPHLSEVWLIWVERVLVELQKRTPCDSGKKDEQISDLCRIEQQQQQKKSGTGKRAASGCSTSLVPVLSWCVVVTWSKIFFLKLAKRRTLSKGFSLSKLPPGTACMFCKHCSRSFVVAKAFCLYLFFFL